MDNLGLVSAQMSLDEIRRRVQLYLRVRWLYIGAIGLAGIIPIYLFGGSNSMILASAVLLAFGAVSTNVLFWFLTRVKRKGMLYFQAISSFFLIIDLVIIAYAVSLGAVTGFRTLVLFSIPILLGGILYGRRETYAMGLLCSATLCTILYLSFRDGHLPTPDFLVAMVFYSTILMIISVLVAYLSTVNQVGELERAKTDLIALASHQLRTPSTAVKGYLSLVLQGAYGKLTKIQRERIADAYLENERQLNLITSLLDVSALDRGELSIHKTDVDLAGLSGVLADIVAEHLELTRARNLKFKTHIPPESIVVHADKERIRLVFQNLVNNACKFAPEGSTVEIRLTDRGKDVAFSVTDRGKGIAKNDRKRLFQRFSPLGGTRAIQGEGAGLGLFVSKRIVELHNGTINVQSTPGKGTTFTVVLPKG